MQIGPTFGRIFEGKVRRKKNITQNIRYEPLREKAKRACGYSPEVMVRITGYGREPGNALANLGYISRTDDTKAEDVDLETNRGEILRGKAEIADYAKGWEQDFGKPNKARRDTMHLMLSMPPGTNPEAVRNATRNFAHRTFSANHEYVFALHTDEPHPHSHLTVKMLGRDGKRLDPNRDDLADWREGFAQALRDEGVDAVATRRAARGVVMKSQNSVERQIQDNPRKGKKRVPEKVVLRELDAINALKAEQGGQPQAARPWEAKIQAEQAGVRSGWIAIAEHLERRPPELVFMPEGHQSRLRDAYHRAATYQSKLSGKRAVDPQKAPSLASMCTVSSIPTLAQVRAVATDSRPATPSNPLIFFSEDSHDRLEHIQRLGAVYQVNVATPHAGEPPRPVADLAALPRIQPSPFGMRLQWRRPVAISSLATMPTLASVNTPVPGIVPVRIPPTFVFTQETHDERPNVGQIAAAVYQSRFPAPRVPPSRSVAGVRDLPRIDVVRRFAPGRAAAQMLLQQVARNFMGPVVGTNTPMRRAGGSPDGDRAGDDRESRTQSRGQAAQTGTGSRERGTANRARSAATGAQGGPESAIDSGRRTDRNPVGEVTYRDIGSVASILKLSAAVPTGADDKALARDIRSFVAGMPSVETARDVLKRELAIRFPAEVVPTAVPPHEAERQTGQGASSQQGQEKGAGQATPKGKELGL
ncbi:MAG: relaxase/mobilization nuclease domain-containing protein [Telluria sp.]